MCTAIRKFGVWELHFYTTGRNCLMGVGALQVLCVRTTSTENKLINYAIIKKLYLSVRTQHKIFVSNGAGDQFRFLIPSSGPLLKKNCRDLLEIKC